MSDFLFERALITNDDGVNAEGIQALERAASKVVKEVWVVAPEKDSSGSSAYISLHEPIRAAQIGERKYSVFGTPSDCVIMACRHFLRDKPPAIVLSGINRGANLADDILFSGTTSAAMTGSFLGIPSVAFSQAYHQSDQLSWSTSEHLVPIVLSRLNEFGWHKGVVYNVNFPDVPLEKITAIESSRQGRGSILAVEVESRVDRREVPYYWFGFTRDKRDQETGTDIAALRRAAISVTPLKLDRTDHELLDSLSKHLEKPLEISDNLAAS
jgi:5'-nucleotidase